MSRLAVNITHARWVGACPSSGGLCLLLDVKDDRRMYRIPAEDAQRALEDLFSLLVVGKAEAALKQPPAPEKDSKCD